MMTLRYFAKCCETVTKASGQTSWKGCLSSSNKVEVMICVREGSNSLVPFTNVTVPVNVLTIGHLCKLAILAGKPTFSGLPCSDASMTARQRQHVVRRCIDFSWAVLLYLPLVYGHV